MLPYLIITAVCHPWIIACPQEVQLAPYSSVRSRSLRSYEPHGQDGWFGSYEGHRSFFYGRLHLRVLGWSRYRRMVEELSSGMRWDLSTSRRMLEPLMRAGPGRVLCALLVSCIAHVVHAHTERCADLPRMGLPGRVLKPKCSDLQSFVQIYREHKRHGFEVYGPLAKYLTAAF